MKLKKISRGLGRGAYFAEGFALYFLPAFLTRLRYHHADSRFSDKEMEEIMTRADYYVRLPNGSRVDSPDARITGDFRFPFHAEKKHTAYFFDIYPFLRMQKKDLRFYYIDEDIDTETPQPTFVKSRPVTASPTNSVLCRLNSLRHFRFVNDTVPFREKDDIIVSRNVVVQPWRIALLEKYFGHPATDFGQTNLTGGRPEWIKPFIPVEEQLRHKFIMCVRGNDVATNLKWVMSSNSIAVMPPPDVESWYMDGLLIPDYHYIAIKPDYSDLIEKTQWYAAHPADAEEIIHNAHQWTARFRDMRIERRTMEEVIYRYFLSTGQLPC